MGNCLVGGTAASPHVATTPLPIQSRATTSAVLLGASFEDDTADPVTAGAPDVTADGNHAAMHTLLPTPVASPLAPPSDTAGVASPEPAQLQPDQPLDSTALLANLVDVPVLSCAVEDRPPSSLDGFLRACIRDLPAAILPVPPVAPLPFTPRRSERIAKFRGSDTPGTISWAQKTLICRLGLADQPDQIDDGALARYKAFFAREATPLQLAALRELFAKDAPRSVDMAAHSAQVEAC